ncbi:MAG TPA: hypothetical protein VFS81_04500 [Candidatus Binatia bacterium]|nr:hypothetical protein [Candidatus Binatia bacterium]
MNTLIAGANSFAIDADEVLGAAYQGRSSAQTVINNFSAVWPPSMIARRPGLSNDEEFAGTEAKNQADAGTFL